MEKVTTADSEVLLLQTTPKKGYFLQILPIHDNSFYLSTQGCYLEAGARQDGTNVPRNNVPGSESKQ